MALGKFFKSLLGAAPRPPAEPVVYEGFSIEPEPIEEEGRFRTAGYISGELDGETRRVRFIRADQHADRQTAIDHSVSKARQIIDEQGARLLAKGQL